MRTDRRMGTDAVPPVLNRVLDTVLRAAESLGRRAGRRRRLISLRGTRAANLSAGYLDSLELLRLCSEFDIRVVYDVGAHSGTWTVLAAGVLGDCEIHAFEPLKAHHAAFRTMCAGIPRVRLHEVALGALSGKSAMRITDRTDSSSLLSLAPAAQKIFGLYETGRETVEVVRLDEYVRRENIPLPDLIKLDIQGAELTALSGGETCLAAAKAVLLEVSFIEFYVGQPRFHAVVEYLADRGFHLYALPAGISGGARLVQTDALFVRDDALTDLAGRQAAMSPGSPLP